MLICIIHRQPQRGNGKNKGIRFGIMINVVLFQPEIPQNTGNIARTCVVTDSHLHIIKPMGFSIDEKHVKRAGLDYWQYLHLSLYESIEELWEKYPGSTFWYFTTHAEKNFDAADFKDGDFIVFGKETAGLPDYVRDKTPGNNVRIPMHETRRCLNLSNAVCVGVYEALRQQGYPNLG